VLDLKPPSASSILAVDQVAALNLLSALEASPLSAARRVLSALVVMLELSTVPIPLSIALLLVLSPVLVVAWVEVLA
jgi:hypothetical protein